MSEKDDLKAIISIAGTQLQREHRHHDLKLKLSKMYDERDTSLERLEQTMREGAALLKKMAQDMPVLIRVNNKMYEASMDNNKMILIERKVIA